MAGSLNDAESWLPAKFLSSEDDVILSKDLSGEAPKNKEMGGFETELGVPSHGFPTEFPYEFDSLDSALSSPVESVVGSTETDSSEEDEDEFFVGLSRRLSRSSSQKLAVPSFAPENAAEKSGVMASSPQSTLSGIGSWSVSSNGSPNGPSQVSSPPMTPFSAQNDASWDLISAAAGQVARLKISSEAPKCSNDALYGRAFSNNNPTSGLYSNQSLSSPLFQSNQFQQQVSKPQCAAAVWGRQARPAYPAQPQFQPQQIQSRAGSEFTGCENARCGRPLGLPQSSWPALQAQSQLQQNSRSGMQAVFLNGSGGAKRQCAGTGVFLPRRAGNPTEYRKRPGCSTVLVPAKVIQALEINAQSQPYFSHETIMARRNAALMAQQRLLNRPEVMRSQDLGLPQDWTY